MLYILYCRKICRNCKCKKEEHNVKEDNSFEHFEILFGDNLKNSNRVKKLCKYLLLRIVTWIVRIRLSQLFIALDLKFKLKNVPGGKYEQGKDSEFTVAKTENDLLFDWIPADIPVNLVRSTIILYLFQ